MSSQTPERETVGIVKTVKNKKVIELINKQGKTVVEFPEIKIEKIEAGESEKKLLENISAFDWLVFSDIFTVDFFIEDLSETGFDIYRLDEIKICSCGEAVADKLRFSQIHSDVIPSINSPQAVLSGISDYVFDNAEFKNSRFLILKARNKNDELTNFFSGENLNVTEISNYKTESNDLFNIAKFKSLLSGGAIDRFIFTSPEDLESIKLLDEEKSLSAILAEVAIEATDEITAQALRENNIEQ